MGISSKCGRFVEYRFANKGPHCFAHLVISKLEILTDFSIPDACEACRSETAVGQQRCKLDERQSVCSKHVKRIAKELICASAEMVETPALSQYRCEFSNADEIGSLLVQRIESD